MHTHYLSPSLFASLIDTQLTLVRTGWLATRTYSMKNVFNYKVKGKYDVRGSSIFQKQIIYCFLKQYISPKSSIF